MPYTYLERLSACSVFCSRDRSATDTGFHHQEQSRIRSQTVFRLIFGSASTRHPGPQALQSHPRVAKESSDRSSARPPCLQVPQSHPRVAKCSSDRSSARPPCPQAPQWYPRVAKPSSIIPSPRPPCPQVLQWHPGVPNNHTISLKPASNRTSTGPRHGHPAHRYSSAIPTCRDVPKPVSERCSERFLTRSSDRLPVRARLSGGRGEKEVGKCLEFRNLGLLQGALDGEGTVQNIDRFH